MGAVVGILVIAAFVAGAWKYQSFKVNGFRARTFPTQLKADQVRQVFEQKVSGMGWSILDAGNPMIARSGPLAGIRQQIGLSLAESPRGVEGHIAVLRYSKKVFGGATKAHTLRVRMSGFLNELRRLATFTTVAG